MKRRRISLLALAFLASSCGGPRYEYPQAMLAEMERGCDDDPEACECVIEWYQNEIPHDELVKFQRGEAPYVSPAEGGGHASPEWDRMNRKLFEVNEECEVAWEVGPD